MKSTIYTSALVLGLATISFLSMNSFVAKSSGSHISSTGAPGEETCNIAYCHSDATVDVGDGVNTLIFSGANDTYIAGNTYTVTINVDNPGVERFGFQVTALDGNDLAAGVFTITDTDRTQKQTGNGRTYVTHKLNGTMATTVGSTSWTFDWTAPSSASGPITFYYATNNTNNNNAASGDEIFLSSHTITSGTGLDQNELQLQDLSTYYKRSSNELKTQFACLKNGSAKMMLFDINGKLIDKWKLDLTSGDHEDSHQLSQFLPSGIYILKSNFEGEKSQIKFLVQ